MYIIIIQKIVSNVQNNYDNEFPYLLRVPARASGQIISGMIESIIWTPVLEDKIRTCVSEASLDKAQPILIFSGS